MTGVRRLSALDGLERFAKIINDLQAGNTYELDMSGTTDMSAKFQELINSYDDDEVLLLAPGTLRIESSISIPNRVVIDARYTRFVTNSDIKIFTLNADGIKIRRCNFIGTDEGAKTLQGGIDSNGTKGFSFLDCDFIDLYKGVNIGATNALPYQTPSSVEFCRFGNNRYGYFGLERSEYVNINSNTFRENDYGIETQGGNTGIVGNIITRGNYGIVIKTGVNSAHGTIEANQINHQNVRSLSMEGFSQGMTVVGNHIYIADILLKDCTGVAISGGIIDVKNFLFENAVGTSILNTRHDTTYPNTVDKEYNAAPPSVIISGNNYLLNGNAFVGF